MCLIYHLMWRQIKSNLYLYYSCINSVLITQLLQSCFRELKYFFLQLLAIVSFESYSCGISFWPKIG